MESFGFSQSYARPKGVKIHRVHMCMRQDTYTLYASDCMGGRKR